LTLPRSGVRCRIHLGTTRWWDLDLVLPHLEELRFSCALTSVVADLMISRLFWEWRHVEAAYWPEFRSRPARLHTPLKNRPAFSTALRKRAPVSEWESQKEEQP